MSAVEPTHQPRDRSVACSICGRDSSNMHAVCLACHNADLATGRCPRCADDPTHVVWPEHAWLDPRWDQAALWAQVVS